jgi:hypothetical protein
MPRARLIGKDGKLYELRKSIYKCGLCMNVIATTEFNQYASCSCGNLSIAGGIDMSRTLNFKVESYTDMSEWSLVEADLDTDVMSCE